MIHNIKKITQMTMKLLFRNKGFLFFCIALPFLATIILNIPKVEGSGEATGRTVIELGSAREAVAYLNDYTLFSVKIYDSSDSQIAQSFIQELAEEGIFQIYRVDTSELSEDELQESARYCALNDKLGAIVMLGDDFAEAALSGDLAESICLYHTGDDERFEMLTSAVEMLAAEYLVAADGAATEEELLQNRRGRQQAAYQVELVAYPSEGENALSLLDVDYGKVSGVGGTLAILSFSFLFTGIMILSTIVKERQNRVYTRILMTKADGISYMLSKFLTIVLVTLIETVFIGIAYSLLVSQDIGLTLFQLLVIAFMMGLIFNGISVCAGICCGSVLTATYIAFFIWVVTALLAGTYFDISAGSELMQQIAMFMPQRWGMKTAQLFMDGNAVAYPMIMIVTFAYLLIILVISVLGLRMKSSED